MADEKKVFDVSKPKANPTSKPVIIGHKSAVKDTTIKVEDGEEKSPVDPLTEKAEEAAIKLDESKLSPAGEKNIEPSDELKAEMKQSADDEAKKNESEKSTKEESDTNEESQADKSAEHQPDEPEPEPEKEKEEPKPEPEKPKSEPVGNEQAVNTVLGEAGTAKQQEVQQLEKDEKVKKLVDEGKYILPIGQPRKHHGKVGFLKGFAIFLVAFIVFSSAMVLAMDAEIVKVNVKLPFDLIKKSQPAEEAVVVTPPPPKTTPTPPPAQKTEEKKVDETGTLTDGNLYTSYDKFYSMRLAEGWDFLANSFFLVAECPCVTVTGKPPTLGSLTPSDKPHEFKIGKSSTLPTLAGIKQTSFNAINSTVNVYYNEKAETGLLEGTYAKLYTYEFVKNGKTVMIAFYEVGTNEEFKNKSTIETMLKSVNIM